MQESALRLLGCVVVASLFTACGKSTAPESSHPESKSTLEGKQQTATTVSDPSFPAEPETRRLSPEFQAKVDAALAKDASMEPIIEVFMSSEFQELMDSMEKDYEPDPEVMAELQQSGDALAAVLNPQTPVSGGDTMRNVTIKQEEVVQEIIRLVVAQDSEGFYKMLIELIDETTVRKALGEEDNVLIVE